MYRVAPVVLVFVLMLRADGHIAAQNTQRQPTLEDFFRFDTIARRDITLSPDGRLVVFTRLRPFGVGMDSPDPYSRDSRSDVWVVSVNGGNAENVTHGAVDGASFWEPKWSPDGQSLMMLSTRGGKTRLWLWERSTNRLRQLSDDRLYPKTYSSDREWISDSEILFTVPLLDDLPGDLAPAGRFTHSGENDASVVNSGPLVSVLESGVPADLSKPDTKIVVLNVETAQKRTIGVTTGASGWGLWKMLRVSPDKRWVAVLKEVSSGIVDPDIPLDERNNSDSKRRYALLLMSVETSASSKVLSMQEDLSFESTLEWSNDSKQILIKTSDTFSAYSTDFVRCNISTADCRPLRPDAQYGWSGGSSLWFGEHQLLIREVAITSNKTLAGVNQTLGSKWRVVDEDGGLRPFGDSSEALPETLSPLPGGSGFAGVVQGAIRQIDLSGRLGGTLVSNSPTPVASITMVGGNTLMFQTNAAVGCNLFALNLETRHVTPYFKPTSKAGLISFEPTTGIGIYLGMSGLESVNGGKYVTNLWSVRLGSHEAIALIETNGFARDIARFRIRMIEYRTSEGKVVGAKLTLPPDYTAAKRYPLIAIVYPGGGYPPSESSEVSFESIYPGDMDDPQILAAHGYVVLEPSMPNFRHDVLSSREIREGKNVDPFMALSDGVLPAINKSIDLGIADPERVGVLGHSHGGYAVYGLITQTSRFKAAVSMSGFADTVSWYGTFEPQMRYSSAAGDLGFAQSFSEMVTRTDGPPWKNLWGYLRNSPVAYVDRVETPLMIVQGDMDVASIQQGEEFFTALKRQNKRGEFVRYWGEGHVVTTPVDLYDMWQRVYAWFDEFLKGNEVTK